MSLFSPGTSGQDGTVNPLLSPPGGLLFQTHLGGGGGLICEWGLISFSKHDGITSSQGTRIQSEKP